MRFPFPGSTYTCTFVCCYVVEAWKLMCVFCFQDLYVRVILCVECSGSMESIMCVFRGQDLHLTRAGTFVCCHLVEVWKVNVLSVSRINMFEYLCVL